MIKDQNDKVPEEINMIIFFNPNKIGMQIWIKGDTQMISKQKS